MTTTFVTFLLLGALLPAPPDGSDFELAGDLESAGTWDLSRLEKEFSQQIRTVEYTLHDQKGSSRCIPLLAVVERAGPRPATKRRNPLLGFAVVVQGDDGYTACFGLADLLPEFGAKEVYIALDKDGGPLPDGDRPIRLIVPSEKRPARWVFGIEVIRVVDTAGLTVK
jgi:hypothetical protein